MKYSNEHEHYMSLQPMYGNDGSGFDRGSIFTICPPWMSAKQDGSDFTAKPYLTVVDVHWIGTDKEYHPSVYPFGSPIYKLFQKLKKESNWILRLCTHDLDWHKPTDLEATCKKCHKIFVVKQIGKGAHTCNYYSQEAVAYRSPYKTEQYDYS